MKTFSKESLIAELQAIGQRGWIPNERHGNHGSVGNTLEDLLGIKENNLPIPNAAEWELKTQRITTTSLTTLFHTEPSPLAFRLVPKLLLPKYGWPHAEAGQKYPSTEMSFRQTISAAAPSDRGFMVKIDRAEQRVVISFEASKVSAANSTWLESVADRVGLDELNPQPYWGFDDLTHKIGSKLLNCFYVQADIKKINGIEYYRYVKVTMLERFSFEGFIKALENAIVYVDFDARTGHNHGTKFRIKQNYLPTLYQKATVVMNNTTPKDQLELAA